MKGSNILVLCNENCFNKMSWRTRKGSLHFRYEWTLWNEEMLSLLWLFLFPLLMTNRTELQKKTWGKERGNEGKKKKSKKKEIWMKRKSHQIKIKDVNLWYFCNAYDFFHSDSWEERNQIILLFKKRKEKKRKEKKRIEKKLKMIGRNWK